MPDKHISYSSRRAYQTCPRLYRYKYIDGYRAIQADTLKFGNLFHISLEEYWKTRGNLELAIKAMRNSELEIDELDLIKAEELMRGYHFRWSKINLDEFQIIDVEMEIKTELRNPETGAASRTYHLIMYLDALVFRNGEVWIVEHKTSGEDITPGSIYWQKLRLDTQISTYFTGVLALGYNVVGCLYDVIGKPVIKPLCATPIEKRKYKKDGTPYKGTRLEDETPDEYRIRLRNHIAENPDRYYQRGEVYRLESEITEAAFDMWQTGKAIRASELANQWPRNTDACFKYKRPCDFWPVCSGECSLDDPRYEIKKIKEDNNDNATESTAA